MKIKSVLVIKQNMTRDVHTYTETEKDRESERDRNKAAWNEE